MSDDGLPLPPPPVSRPTTSMPGANDLDVQMVRDKFNEVATSSNAAVEKWADKLAGAAAKGAPVKAPEFKGGGPGLLSPVETELDTAMGVDTNRTGLGAMFGSVAKGMGYMLTHPYTAATDPAAIARIKEAQAQFLAENAGTLTFMQEQMSAVTRSLGAISDLLRTTSFARGPLDQIMKDKEACGDRALADITDALRNSTDPDERAALEKQKQRLDDFMKQSADRIAAEKPTVDSLADRMSTLGDEVARQQQAIEQARRTRGPVNETAGGKITDSTHIRPEAIDYARGLRDLLAGSRVGLNKAMSGSGQ